MLWCLLVFTVILADGADGGAENSTNPKWISEYMPRVLGSLMFGDDKFVTPECRRHGRLYKRHLSNQTLWAVTMHDSAALHWNSLVMGGTYHYGSFDACLSVDVPAYSLVGRYCIVDMELGPMMAARYFNRSDYGLVVHPGPFESIWALFKETEDPRITKKDHIRFGLCIPSGCTHNDLQTDLGTQLLPALRAEGLNVKSFDVREPECIIAKDVTKFDFSAYVYLSLVGLLILTVATVSGVHGYLMSEERQLEFNKNWLSSFSVLNTGKKLMVVEGPPELRFLSALKMYSMCIIIFGHRYLTMLYAPLANVIKVEKKYSDFWEMLLFNGPLLVNTFLVISGFFTYFKILHDIKKGRGVNVPLYVYGRWMRVSWIYAVVLLFAGLILPHYILGSIWKVHGVLRYGICRRNWWAHILYINNYYKAEEECIPPGWYLAVDMQLFVVAVLVGWCVSKWRSTEIPLLASLLTLSLAIPTVVTYVHGHPPFVTLYLNYIRNYWKQDDYVNSYIKTHMRAAPYILGMITAKIYFILKGKKFEFSKLVRFLMTTTTLSLILFTTLSAWPFFQSMANPSRIVSALYSTFSKVAWAIGICVYILAQCFGGLGLREALASEFYVPFNRLTLCTLLVHPLIQARSFLSMKQPLYINGWLVFWSAACDVAVSYFLSVFLFLFIESPISALNDHILRRLFLKPKVPPETETELKHSN